MKMSKRCQYGVRACVRLAQTYGDGNLQSKEIAASEALPAKFIESILLALRAGDVLESKVGAGGGYRLKRSPTEILMMDICRAMAGNDADKKGDPDATGAAGIGQVGLDIVFERLDGAINEAIGSVSLAAVLEQAEERASVGNSHLHFI